MRVGLLSGQPAVTIRHGFDLLTEIKNSNTQVGTHTLTHALPPEAADVLLQVVACTQEAQLLELQGV